jgi:hypothetical protein
MSREFIRNIAVTLQLILLGPLVGGLLTMLRAGDGGTSVSPLLASSPALGLILLVVISVLAAIIGLVDGRVFGVRSGMRGMGIILGWAAINTGRTEDILRINSPMAVSIKFAAESLVISIAVVWFVRQLAVMTERAERTATGEKGPELAVASMARGPSLMAAGAACVGGLVGAWFAAFHGAKGQTLFAGMIGGIAAGAFAAIVSAGSESKSGQRTVDPVISACLGMALASVVAPFSIAFFNGPDPLANALAGKLFRIGHLNGLDWAAGALVGIPVGLGWAGAHAQHGASERLSARPARLPRPLQLHLPRPQHRPRAEHRTEVFVPNSPTNLGTGETPVRPIRYKVRPTVWSEARTNENEV